jgi:hypothetical protein
MILALGWIACRPSDHTWNGTIELKDGVEIVKNPTEPVLKDNPLELVPNLTIGESNEKDQSLFSGAQEVAVDNTGKIFALDVANAVIGVFDQDGTYLKTIGRKGQGPGEMQMPTSIYITPQATIMVNDPGARKLHYFDLEGNFEKAVTQRELTMFQEPKADQNGDIVARHTIPGAETFTVLEKFSPNLDRLLTLRSLKVLTAPKLNPYFIRAFWAINSKNQIVWGFSDRYEINITDATGKLIRKITKEHSPVEISEDEKSGWIKQRFGGDEFIPKGITLVWDKFHNAYNSLSVDGKEHLFVGTFEKDKDSGDYIYDIFDKHGRFLARTSFHARPRIWKEGLLYMIEADKDGQDIIRRYRVIWRNGV